MLVKIYVVLVSMATNNKNWITAYIFTATDAERLCVEYYSQVSYSTYGNGAKYVGVV